MPDALRTLEANSIRGFVQKAADLGYLSGRVLDYGCGKQPYRDIVEEAGAEYVGFDRAEFPANVSGEDVGEEDEEWDDWDAILCTQILQYVERPSELLGWFHHILKDRQGHLVLTYPTTWPEVELEDLHRFTKVGMEKMLFDAEFDVVVHECRASTPLVISGQMVALGYGVICRA